MKKYLFLTILFLSLFFVPIVFAESLSISETIQEIDLVPGGAEHFSFVLKNNTDNNLDIRMERSGFRFKGDNGEVELFSDSKNELINSWLKPLDPTSFELLKGERKRLTFLVSIPPDTKDGGYYAAVYFVGKSSEANMNDLTVVPESKSDNVLVFLGVDREDDNTLLREGRAIGLNLPNFVFYGPIDFGVKFENSGEIHYKPHGQIDVYNFFNKKTAVIPLEEANVLPNSNLYIHGIWERKYLLGRYLIVARMFDGDGNPSVITKRIWTFSWKEVLFVIFIITLIIISRKLRVKKIKYE